MPMPVARTLPDLLDELAQRHPAREALVGGAQRFGYGALRAEVRAVAKGLHALGVRRGDKVAILMGNRPEWIIADLAITLLGGVMVGLNTWATAPELDYLLSHSDTTVLITADRYLKYDYLAMLDAIARPAALREILVLGDSSRPGYRRYEDLVPLGAAVPDAVIDAAQRAIEPRDLAYLLYTSGSTSRPKGVQLQHLGLIENMWHIGERLRMTGDDRLWLAVSLFWGFACENALMAMMTHGGTTVLQEHFDAGDAIELIARERCTIFYGTANMVQAIDEHPARATRDLSCLRRGATLGTPEQMRRAIRLMPDVSQVYGSTETYGNCTVADAGDPADRRAETMGQPLPGVEIRIVDPETGERRAIDQVGEIRVKGYVTPGYYKNPEGTAASFDADGFFLTGDLGLIDADGRVRFRGRIKEMVKTGGINVAPIEVEEVLLAHPAVQLAFVVGVPDAARDEILAAAVVLKQPGAADAEALLAHCRTRLAAYKLPRLFKFVAESDLPLTVTGKIQKNRIAAVIFSPPA